MGVGRLFPETGGRPCIRSPGLGVKAIRLIGNERTKTFIADRIAF